MAASRAHEPVGGREGTRGPANSRTRLNADTSSQPEGLTRRVMLNILEAFFRRPILHLLPLGLMLGVGLASVVNGKEEFQSVGTLSVTNVSLLADLTDAAQNNSFTFESPSTVTARQINELLRTNEFLDRVTADAGLDELVEQGQLTLDQIRRWTTASPDGESLVRISATTPQSGELSFRLSDATIKSYRAWVIDAAVSQSTSTEVSLEARVAEKQLAADEADAAVRAKILEDPDVAMEERPLVVQEDFKRLQSVADRANDQLVVAKDALDEARTNTDQAAAIVNQRLRVLDPPEPALAPLGRLRNAALTMFIFAVLGVVLSIATVVISATLDRTIRVPNDITSKFGVDVLAVVPEMSR